MNLPKQEEEILKFWKKNKIFEKSLEKTKQGKIFRFYDGPPFATGLPHYGHVLPGTIKDVIPRYKTMRGFFVERRWGWDCHGLPVEYEVEKELKISGKKEIEKKVGIKKFNEACKDIVLRYTEEWRKTVERTGRWVDMDNAYLTMNPEYMESIWWVFKSLQEKDLIYEGHKILPYCPRCGTPLSNFEANMPGAYQDVKDPAITVRFKLLDEDQKDTYLLAWTTTPWTLPSNIALAVGSDVDYVEVKDKEDNNHYILAAERLKNFYHTEEEYEIIKKSKGKTLTGLKYEPLFHYFERFQNTGFKVVEADFVSAEDGTGIVHIAPAFGEDDNELGKKEDLPMPNPVDEHGCFTDEVENYKGMQVKEADLKIIKDLKEAGKIIKKEIYKHSYPHCWRCDTPLIYKAVSTWFVAVTKIKDKMLKNNEKIYWMPEHLKHGRFGKWLEEARDWAVSRNRFWGSPLPIWRHKDGDCDNVLVIGSREELEKLSKQKVKDLHKHFVDKIEIKCEKCDGVLTRVPEILDCWFESGAMPYGEYHYPFKNKKKFEQNYPAEFIAESIDQTRGWFYTLLVLSTALFDKPAFLNVVVSGLVLAEDGKKMSKRLKNYPEPKEILDKHGADALRLYLMGSPAAKAEELRFTEKDVAQTSREFLFILQNIFSFWKMHAGKSGVELKPSDKNVLDKWILSKLNILTRDLTASMDKYDLPKSVRLLREFINEFSTWYLRRSRGRFKTDDKKSAHQTLGFVLQETSKLIAPFAPFMADSIYQGVKGEKESVHLEDWISAGKIDEKILKEMKVVRDVCEAGHAERERAGIKVRQPLAKITINNQQSIISNQLLDLIKDELNIKEVDIKKGKGKLKAVLDTKITDNLKREGYLREIIRMVNSLRKQAGFTIADRATLSWKSDNSEITKIFKDFEEDIKKGTSCTEINNKKSKGDIDKDIKIADGVEVWVGVKKV
ncbi:MAG: isoleucine--tRNA ligase [Patescibacteria group bacterium]|nr:isoleucine--tRNA ligase [Patescibacteria group bacterium]